MLFAAALSLTLTLAPAAIDPAAEWQQVCEHFRQLDHPYFGGAAVTRLQAELVASPPEDEAAANATRLLRLDLAERLTQEGRADEAFTTLRPLVDNAAELDRDHRERLFAILALAHLQAGEDLNCRLSHTGSACLVPFDEQATHRQPEHAREAGRWLEQLIALDPNAARWAWLANVAAMATDEWPARVPEAARLRPGGWTGEPSPRRWPNRAPQLGLGAEDLAGAAIMDDFDGDGRLDLISTTWDPCGPARGFRQAADGTFEDMTTAWRLDEQLGGLNAIHGDVDGDGRLDLLILRGGWLRGEGMVRNSLLLNRANPDDTLRFVDVTTASGLGPPAPTQTAAFADIDGDGDLDLFIGNESTTTERTVSQLWRNDGVNDSGVPRFTDITATAGVANLRYAKGVAFGDVDNDGDPDLYVSNLGANRLYLNRGDGTFIDRAEAAGVSEPSGWSFAVAFFDLDNDGDLDLFVADYGSHTEEVAAGYLGRPVRGGHPRVYRNESRGPEAVRFVDISAQLGLRQPLTPMGMNVADVDSDGFPDLYLGTGEPALESLVPNVLYTNFGGVTLRDSTVAYGLGHLQKGHGVAFGDLDSDGDVDLFHQLGGFFAGDAFANAVFENTTARGDHLTLRLEGRASNRFAVGARVAVHVRAGRSKRTIHALVGTGGSFGGNSLAVEIGLGSIDTIDDVVIRWPRFGEGVEAVQHLGPLSPNRRYRVIEGEGARADDLPSVRLGGDAAEPHSAHADSLEPTHDPS